MTRFTPERRERWLSLIESGVPQSEACLDVEVSPTTVGRWRSNGRAGRSPEAVAFAERLDAVTEGTSASALGVPELVALMERQARRGSVTAIRWLVERLEHAAEDVEPERSLDIFDELDGRRRQAAGAHLIKH